MNKKLPSYIRRKIRNDFKHELKIVHYNSFWTDIIERRNAIKYMTNVYGRPLFNEINIYMRKETKYFKTLEMKINFDADWCFFNNSLFIKNKKIVNELKYSPIGYLLFK